MKFYQVVQGKRVVGYFLNHENAKTYLKQFNTRVFIAPVFIKEEIFLDGEDSPEGKWLDDNDTTSEMGGV